MQEISTLSKLAKRCENAVGDKQYLGEAIAFLCEEIDKIKEQLAHNQERIAAHDNREQVD